MPTPEQMLQATIRDQKIRLYTADEGNCENMLDGVVLVLAASLAACLLEPRIAPNDPRIGMLSSALDVARAAQASGKWNPAYAPQLSNALDVAAAITRKVRAKYIVRAFSTLSAAWTP